MNECSVANSWIQFYPHSKALNLGTISESEILRISSNPFGQRQTFKHIECFKLFHKIIRNKLWPTVSFQHFLTHRSYKHKNEIMMNAAVYAIEIIVISVWLRRRRRHQQLQVISIRMCLLLKSINVNVYICISSCTNTWVSCAYSGHVYTDHVCIYIHLFIIFNHMILPSSTNYLPLSSEHVFFFFFLFIFKVWTLCVCFCAIYLRARAL